MYNKEYKGDVCSHSHSFFLDNFFRRLIQNPKKIVGNHINEGDIVVDLGCGPGYFSIDMAKMVGPSGKVFAADLQKEMLEKVAKKAKKFHLDDRIILHNCPQDQIGLSQDIKADFILAFYMVHETPDHIKFLKEVKTLLKKGGKFLLAEPRFHVSENHFQKITRDIKDIGFIVLNTDSGIGSRSLLLSV
ncbi:MAG: class I SAM-dependent methyltransferase [Proteobacteria bacterium]|nr:class I SAM-dependent methyltransferase [Pseudomonadota bacterium]MBU1583738.1 class I SAM-dependent methyltransferase [Pseudomonadota bacterium]MBU2631124.1 class I SAM-dependent methyltransferase [Pseudomonadota bacterium]